MDAVEENIPEKQSVPNVRNFSNPLWIFGYVDCSLIHFYGHCVVVIFKAAFGASRESTKDKGKVSRV